MIPFSFGLPHTLHRIVKDAAPALWLCSLLRHVDSCMRRLRSYVSFIRDFVLAGPALSFQLRSSQEDQASELEHYCLEHQHARLPRILLQHLQPPMTTKTNATSAYLETFEVTFLTWALPLGALLLMARCWKEATRRLVSRVAFLRR